MRNEEIEQTPASGGSPLNDGLDGQTLHEMLCAGWEIHPTSCGCGGHYAWLKPRESGALEMVGCVCHNTNNAMMQFKAVLPSNAN